MILTIYTKVSKYIHPITLEVAYEVASNLRPEDEREVREGHGLTPTIHIPLYSQHGDCVYFTIPNGETAGIAGVNKNGSIWMLCTPSILKYPLFFVKESKRFVESRTEPLLWNIADKRNTVHLKLLKFLGFNFLREVTHGPNNLSFIEFARCARQQ